MTGEEMERAIEFLLQSQAKTEAQLAQTGQQLSEFAQFTRANIEALNEHTRTLRETVRALTIRQAQMEDRLTDLEGNK
jgi:predicted TIM-barrel fold metal-dependent hydrolase